MDEKLKQFGLSDKEALVWSALFEIPGSVVTEVAKKAKLNRSTTYVLLESLSKSGLVSASERRGVRTYSPVSSDHLIEIAEAKLAESQNLVTLSHELAESLKNASSKPSSQSQVKLYESDKGVKIVSKIKLGAKEPIRSYTAIEDMRKAFPKFFPTLEKKYAKNSRQLVPNTSETRDYLRNNSDTHGQVSLVEDNEFKSNLDIFDNKTTFVSPEEGTALIIESAQFTQAMKTIFDLAFTKAKPWNVHAEEKPKEKLKKDRVLVKAQNRFFGKS